MIEYLLQGLMLQVNACILYSLGILPPLHELLLIVLKQDVFEKDYKYTFYALIFKGQFVVNRILVTLIDQCSFGNDLSKRALINCRYTWLETIKPEYGAKNIAYCSQLA